MPNIRERLGEACQKALAEFHPQLVMGHAAGAPIPRCMTSSALRLALTIEGLKARDKLVFDLQRREQQASIATTFAGGYARDVNDTVTISTRTL